MKFITPIAALLIAATAWGTPQDPPQESVHSEAGFVNISAKGEDVRSVLFDLFRQTNNNFVLDSGVRWVLYLHLEKVTFEQALDIVAQNAEIGYEVKNGVYYIGKGRKTTKTPTPTTKPNPTPQQEDHTPTAPPLPQNTNTPKLVTEAELQKRLTTRFSVTPIRKVFEEFTRQTGIKIEVDASVPDYKLDAFLIDTSLKYSLDVICDAAKLKWSKAPNGTIKVEKEH
jgi:type II secretory pathway component HofQ